LCGKKKIPEEIEIQKERTAFLSSKIIDRAVDDKDEEVDISRRSTVHVQDYPRQVPPSKEATQSKMWNSGIELGGPVYIPPRVGSGL